MTTSLMSLIPEALYQAGEILRHNPPLDVECNDALSVLSQWRLLHYDPTWELQRLVNRTIRRLNLQPVLRGMHLQRQADIVTRLQRSAECSLAKLANIGSVIAVVSTTQEAQLLADALRKTRYQHLTPLKGRDRHPLLINDTDERSIVFRSPSPIEHHDALFVTVHIRTQKEQHEIFDRELALAEKRRVNSSPTEARLSPVQLPIIGVVSPVADWFLLIFDTKKERTSITPFTKHQAKYAEWIWAELERQYRSNPAMHIQLVGGNDPYVLPVLFPSAFAINDRSWRLALKSFDTMPD